MRFYKGLFFRSVGHEAHPVLFFFLLVAKLR